MGEMTTTLYYMRYYTLHYSVLTPAVIGVLHIIIPLHVNCRVMQLALFPIGNTIFKHSIITRHIAFTLQWQRELSHRFEKCHLKSPHLGSEPFRTSH